MDINENRNSEAVICPICKTGEIRRGYRICDVCGTPIIYDAEQSDSQLGNYAIKVFGADVVGELSTLFVDRTSMTMELVTDDVTMGLYRQLLGNRYAIYLPRYKKDGTAVPISRCHVLFAGVIDEIIPTTNADGPVLRISGKNPIYDRNSQV